MIFFRSEYWFSKRKFVFLTEAATLKVET